MQKASPIRLTMMVSVAVLALTISGCALRPHGMPAAEGIGNFGRVDGTFWRGAQPDDRGLENLKKLGVATIINLRMPNDIWPGEELAARRNGIGYVNVPLHGFSGPSDAEVGRVLMLVESSPAPVFVHCKRGADRTGLIAACYRMRHDGWTLEQALAEARRFGMSEWQLGMKRYLREFLPKPAPIK